MADYAIIRVEKLKDLGAVVASARHAFRERNTPNADPALILKNKPEGAEKAEDVVQGVRDRITPLVKRKDSVVCLEYLISASPEAFRDGDLSWSEMQQGYFKDSLDWLKQRHGAENVVASMIHNDETTPHMTVYVVPVAGTRLSAKHFCGGREKLVKLQTDFAEQVGNEYGVQRGKHRGVGDERVTHQTVKEWYGKGIARLQEEITAQKANLELERAKLEESKAWLASQHSRMSEELRKRGLELDSERDRLAAVTVKLDQREAALKEREAFVNDRIERFNAGVTKMKAGQERFREDVEKFKEARQAFDLATRGHTPGQVKKALDDLDKKRGMSR